MKNDKKKKGYVLAIVMIISFVMTFTIAATFTVVMKYMFIAKNDLQDTIAEKAYYYNVEEGDVYANL